MFEHLMHATWRAIVRALIAVVVGGTLAVTYGAGLIWLAERTSSLQPIWLLAASLGLVTGVASAGLVLVWRLAPAIAALRGLEFLAEKAPEAAEQAAHQALPAPGSDAPALELPAAVGALTREQTASLPSTA
ncbi:MAG TPA: hypothetical protein VGS80_08350 [Ktedonobacterales bacterium]|nr:hypothetical protein [Ktedonobacterales bacterium]